MFSFTFILFQTDLVVTTALNHLHTYSSQQTLQPTKKCSILGPVVIGEVCRLCQLVLTWNSKAFFRSLINLDQFKIPSEGLIMTTRWFFHQSNEFLVLNYDSVHSFFHSPSPLQAHPSPRKVIRLPSGRTTSSKMVSQHIIDYQPMVLLSNLYIPTLLGKIFKFILFRLLKNAFGSQKLILDIFCHALRQKYPRFL